MRDPGCPLLWTFSLHRCHILYMWGPSKEMSGIPIDLSGDTLYMSSTLIKVMLFFRDILLVYIEGEVLRTLNF